MQSDTPSTAAEGRGGKLSDTDPHPVFKMLLGWDEKRHGHPSTWDIGRGACIGGIRAARILQTLSDQGAAESIGRDRYGARLWRLTEQGQAAGREALSREKADG